MLSLQKKGHYARNCGRKNNEQLHTTFAYSSNDDSEGVEHIFHQSIMGILSNTWLLLDNQSSVDQFMNPKYLRDISTVEKSIYAYCNAGKPSTNQHGMFGGMKIWYKPAGTANVISLKTVKSKFRVTYDSEDRGRVFMVHTSK